MYGTPVSAATLAIFSAMIRACTSLSMTHGPAIRKRGLPPPRRKEPKLISLPAVMRSFEDNTEAGGVAKAGKRVPMQEKPDRLFANTAGDEVYYDGRVDGDLVVAPTIRPGRYPGMHLPAHLH